MKLFPLLVLACCSVIVISESTDSSKQELLARASAQLERLAPYRRISSEQGTTDEQWQLLENAAKDPGMKKLSDLQAFEIYRILPEDMQRDIANKVGGNRAMIELLANPKYMELMQDRIKRSGTKRDSYEGYESPPDGYPTEEYGGYGPESYGDHYGGQPEASGSDSGQILKGSGSLIGGLAKGIIGGIVSASGASSKGSSSISAQSSQSSAHSSSQSSSYDNKKPEYGQVYSYGDKAFDVWDFKKAIISTLMQAVKAISGGVIALKGQLLKGSGYLVSTKGKIITKAGDAVTTLGRNIAKSAVYPPHHPPSHPGYSYDHSPDGGFEESYDGPPPHVEDYAETHEYHGNSNYESSSDVGDQAGLLIVKPTNQDDHDHHNVDLDIQKPVLTQLEDNYHGPPPELPNKDVENSVIGNGYQNFHQDDHHNVGSSHHSSSGHDISLHQHSLNDHKGHDSPVYPPLASALPLKPHTPFSIQQSVEYPPLHIQYSVPNKENLDLHNADTSSNDLSVYSSLSIDVDPSIQTIKLPPVKAGGFDLPKLQPHANFHNVPLLSNSYSVLQEPLKISLLNPYPMPYWQNQGLLQPYTNFNLHGLYRRRSSAQKRRSISEIAQRMRLHRG